MNTARKHIALIICLSLLLVSVLSALLIAEHLDHDCPGEHCEICAVITHFSHTLGQLGTASAVCTALAMVLCLSSIVSLEAVSVRETPISLKVQLNN